MKLKYMVGTMVETPRAALTADRIAEVAEFFSFGTNDLTQTVMALSRDDAGRFLPDYVDRDKADIFKADPFQTLDREGVGVLIKHAIKGGRGARKDLKIGICGEHGGDPESVHFCHEAGMAYVSCSPYRVPIARLAAAQAAIDTPTKSPRKPKPSKRPRATKRKAATKKKVAKKKATKKGTKKKAAKVRGKRQAARR